MKIYAKLMFYRDDKSSDRKEIQEIVDTLLFPPTQVWHQERDKNYCGWAITQDIFYYKLIECETNYFKDQLLDALKLLNIERLNLMLQLQETFHLYLNILAYPSNGICPDFLFNSELIELLHKLNIEVEMKMSLIKD